MSFSQYCSKTTAVRNDKKCDSIGPYHTHIHIWHGDCLHPSSASRASVFSKTPGCLEDSPLPADRDRSWWCALLPLLHCIFSPQSDTESHRAETLTMLMPVELVVVGMLGEAEWLKGAGVLLCTGPWRPSPSGLRSGGAGRLMIAVVIRPPLQLILLLLSSFRFRLERPERLKYRGREEKDT